MAWAGGHAVESGGHDEARGGVEVRQRLKGQEVLLELGSCHGLSAPIQGAQFFVRSTFQRCPRAERFWVKQGSRCESDAAPATVTGDPHLQRPLVFELGRRRQETIQESGDRPLRFCKPSFGAER